MRGSEVAQLYVSGPGGVWGPTRQLRGFAKVGLEGGESREVFVPFDRYTFRHYSTELESWQEEQGTWAIMVGRDVEDLPLSQSLEIDGLDVAEPDPALGGYLTGDLGNLTDACTKVLLGRPVPVETTSPDIERNDPVLDLARSRSFLARFAVRTLRRRQSRKESRGTQDLNTLFMLNMPLRAMAKMTAGAVDEEMVDGIVDLVNGRAGRGLRRVLVGYVRNRRADRVSRQDLKMLRERADG